MGAVVTAEQFAHQRGFRRPIREKTRPARHKTPISVHFSFAGRTISRMGRSHVAALKPMTPLRPLMQASMKPPSPLLAPEQQPLKPTTPLQPKNTPKTPISHPQRRWRFQLRLSLREQRQQGFQPHTGTSEQRRHRFQTTARMVCGHALRHQQAPIRPPLRKLARNLSRSFFETPQNVEIPTNTIKILKQPQGNYVRN